MDVPFPVQNEKDKTQLICEIAHALYVLLQAHEKTPTELPDHVPLQHKHFFAEKSAEYVKQTTELSLEHVKKLISRFGFLTNPRFQLSPKTLGELCALLNCNPTIRGAQNFREFLPREIIPLLYPSEPEVHSVAIDIAHKAFRDMLLEGGDRPLSDDHFIARASPREPKRRARKQLEGVSAAPAQRATVLSVSTEGPSVADTLPIV